MSYFPWAYVSLRAAHKKGRLLKKQAVIGRSGKENMMELNQYGVQLQCPKPSGEGPVWEEIGRNRLLANVLKHRNR